MNERGFSLVELLVVVMIFGILAGVGIINFNSSTGNYLTQTASEQLVQELRATRSAAIARNATVQFVHAGSNIYAIQRVNAGVVVETIRNNIVIGLEPGDVNLNFTNLQGASVIVFNGRGQVANAQPGTIPSIIVSRGGARTFTVRIQPSTGYIR